MAVIAVSGIFAGISLFAEAEGYKSAGSSGSGQFKAQIQDITVDSKDNVIATDANGNLVITSPDGITKKISTGVKDVSTVTCDKEGNIYLLATGTTMEEYTYQGRKYKRNTPTGVSCTVFSPAGEKSRSFIVKDVKSAKTAKLVGGKLLIADMKVRKILVCDAQTGDVTASIGDNLRLCCGIFQFSTGPDNNSIVVANLGAFQVQTYDLSGKKTAEFGSRGNTLNEFHGCCNPVSVAVLPDGSYITAEKDPTRIKIYDKDGKTATAVAGVDELVKGCSDIPIAVDSKGNIYLAANREGSGPMFGPAVSNQFIVKCVKNK